MIKPKYKKGLDVSQLARSIVEHATRVPLTPPKPLIEKSEVPLHRKKRRNEK
jgi:hypothetical protein